MREKAFKSLTEYIQSKTSDYEDTLAKWYRESEFYREPLLRDVFGETISHEVEEFKVILAAGEDVSRFVEMFEKMAISFGASWYDEDLDMIREGNPWETEICTDLRNIAAQAEGKPLADWQEFYEGYTG